MVTALLSSFRVFRSAASVAAAVRTGIAANVNP
jgi:hypothetical protein